MMTRLPLWQRFLLGLALLLPLACNLTTVAPTATAFPTSTPIANISTMTPSATSTRMASPTPTKTTAPPQPTAKPVYNLSQPVPAPICAIVPNVEAANIRSGPGTNFPVIGVMLANNWVMPSRLNSSGWYQIVALGTVVNGGWISNIVVDLQQPCICTPDTCTQSGIVPPAITPSLPRVGVVGLVPADGKACIVTGGGNDVPIFRVPGDDTSVLAILIPYGGVGASDFRDGRYSVVFSVGAQALSGWVNANRVTVQGGCDQLRVPVVCSVQAPIGGVALVHTEPKRDAPVMSTMSEYMPLPFIQKNADGWFNVNVGSSGNGWVAPDEGMLVGPCR